MENNTKELVIKDELSNEEIKNLIYTIRGKQVMLDSDVAMLYHYETKVINQTVKRNIQRFPEKFCFQLAETELKMMWSQFVTTSTSRLEYNKYRSKKYLPYAFTEQGISILTSTKSNIQKIDIQKFNKEYPTLKVAYTSKFHDRFILIDNKEMYHLGASVKDLGTKCFGINKIEDVNIIGRFIKLF